MKKVYSEEQKKKIVEMYFAGKTITEILNETGVARSTLTAWIKEYEQKPKSTKQVNMRDYNDLKQKCEQQEKMIQILWSSPCTVSAPLSERYEAVKYMLEKFGYSVTLTCKTLKVDKGSYYNHTRRNKNGNTIAAQRNAKLLPIIQKIFEDSNRTYGADKIHYLLKQQGHVIGRNTVAKIMHENDLFSSRGGAKKLYDQSQERKLIISNQNFEVTRPNQVWVGDVTQFNINDKKFYICIILDLYARKIVGCKVSTNNSTHLIKCTFKQAYEDRSPTDLLFHSDQGANYASKTYMNYLKELGVQQSFARARMPYDNSRAEAFFKTLKAEKLYHIQFRTELEFRQAVSEYILHYNEDRPHTVLRYMTPSAYEAAYYEQLEKRANNESNTTGS